MALTPGLDGRIASANDLMEFVWPIGQASVALLKKQCQRTMKYACTEMPRELETAESVAEVSAALLAMADNHPRRIMVRPELIMAPDFPHRSEAPAAFRHPFEKIWPIQTGAMQWTSALLNRARQGLYTQEVEPEKVQQIFERQLRTALLMMVTPTRGVDPTFERLARDLAELSDFVEKGTNVAAEVARAFFQEMAMMSPKTAEFPEQRPMPLLSAILAQKTAYVRSYLNVSAAQVEAFIPIEASGHGMGGDDFGQLQQTWLLKGPFDVSYVLDVLVRACLRPCGTKRTTPRPDRRRCRSSAGTTWRTSRRPTRQRRGRAAGCLQQFGLRPAEHDGQRVVRREAVGVRPAPGRSFRIDEAVLDKRQICVAAGNGMYDLPFESRCTVKLMGRNEKTSTATQTGGS